MTDRFDIEQVIRILGLEIRADQADEGRDFDVACRIALEKLRKCKEYEYLEEQGLLLKLPCKIGSPVYMVEWDCGGDAIECRRGDCEDCPHRYYFVEENCFDSYMCDDIGKTVFLTQTEAEEKLKEMSK